MANWNLKIGMRCVGMLFLLALCLALTVHSQVIFGESSCSNELVRSVVSENTQFVANLIRRNCGGATAYSNLVFLKKLGDATDKDGRWGEKVYISRGESPIVLAWRNNELWIETSAMEKDVFLKKDIWGEVKIVYR